MKRKKDESIRMIQEERKYKNNEKERKMKV